MDDPAKTALLQSRYVSVMSLKLRRQNIVDVSLHLSLTLLASVFVYAQTRHAGYTGLFILAGIFVDADHWIDYCLYYGKKVRFLDFFNSNYLHSGKIYVFLHSWELDAFLGLGAWVMHAPWLGWFCLGLTLHLAIDTLARKNPLFYFFTYRLLNRFEAMVILPEYRRFMSQMHPPTQKA